MTGVVVGPPCSAGRSASSQWTEPDAGAAAAFRCWLVGAHLAQLRHLSIAALVHACPCSGELTTWSRSTTFEGTHHTQHAQKSG